VARPISALCRDLKETPDDAAELPDRVALKQGAELAITLEAEVHVLIVVRDQALNAAVVAGSLGRSYIVDGDARYDDVPSAAELIERITDRFVNEPGGHFQ
jgi:hypothetical protein